MPIVIGAGGPADRAYLPLATRRGTLIPNERRLEQAPARIRAACELFQQERPNAQLRSATGVYNCMGMAFASRRTWVDTGHLGMILEEDQHRPVASVDQVCPGDLVVYRSGHDGSVTHVAIVLETEPRVETAS
jgi:hypothetical protein